MGAAPALCALVLKIFKPARGLWQWSVFFTTLFANHCYFEVTTILNNGIALGPQGYMFFQIAVLLVSQSSSFPMIISGHILIALYPHLLGLLFPETSFVHIDYAIMIWPAAAACMIAQYYIYIQYEQNWRLRKKLEEMASHDSLTGLFNRRAFLERANDYMTLIKRHRRLPVSVLMIDADFFKRINDTYGHDTGDQVLRELSATIKNNSRTTDLQCRWGGEEFLIMLPDTDISGALLYSERMMQSIRAIRIDTLKKGIVSFTVSIGIAGLTDTNEDINSLISRADDALYSAKSQGRDRIQCAE